MIGVVSGKGGVGKSLVTSMLAVIMNRMVIIPLFWMRTSLDHPSQKHWHQEKELKVVVAIPC